MTVAVSGEQAREASPPRYWLLTVSRATMPKSSLMPKRVIMALASLVACSMSLEAPVVMEWKIKSSATRPPVKVAILFSSSSLVIRLCSSWSTCMVYPRAPEVLGTMVILVTGAEWL